jgi:hypothetical protein
LISSRFWRHEQSVENGAWAHQNDVVNGLYEDGERDTQTKLLSQRSISGDSLLKPLLKSDVRTDCPRYRSLTVEAVEVDDLVLGVLLDEKEDHM